MDQRNLRGNRCVDVLMGSFSAAAVDGMESGRDGFFFSFPFFARLKMCDIFLPSFADHSLFVRSCHLALLAIVKNRRNMLLKEQEVPISKMRTVKRSAKDAKNDDIMSILLRTATQHYTFFQKLI